ncbi:MAG: deoxyribodipyrimidine photo-lyase [Pseudomonadota bacterium]
MAKNGAAVNVVWFKRDLRTEDHRVLSEAAQAGAVLPLFIVEDDFWHLPDASARQWSFVVECLHSLRDQLGRLGQPLCTRRGDAVSVLRDIHREIGITALWSHEETGNAWTYERDKRVAAWCRAEGILWHETQQHGTQRRLTSRNGWAKAWDAYMGEPLTSPPQLKPLPSVALGDIPTARDLGMARDVCPERQPGGRANALERLDTFLHERGEPYRKEMSNPLAGATACSRLSPYLAWGAVSMREVAQATWSRQRALKQAPPRSVGGWRGAMRSFSGRLHWHCHFMQKLEDEPKLEFENLHPAYNGMRPEEPDAARLHAWSVGETGLPFVDACMRFLSATGWLNFRMRAMVTATASYHLWLDWRKPGEHLARQFTDYEPGIHWPQIQMQSGTTGINTVRIYNPVKQGHDQDPDGFFVRRWVPELADIEDKFLQEPWKADNASQVLGKAYPFPIVDHLTAAKEARQKIWAVRGNQAFRSKAKDIQNKHGSRKSGVPMRGQKAARKSDAQLCLSFDDEKAS